MELIVQGHLYTPKPVNSFGENSKKAVAFFSFRTGECVKMIICACYMYWNKV